MMTLGNPLCYFRVLIGVDCRADEDPGLLSMAGMALVGSRYHNVCVFNPVRVTWNK
jgi:hypothetical protein